MTSRLLVDKIEGKSTSSHVIMPTGMILQQQQSVSNSSGHIITTSSTPVASGISVSITPKATGNKIIVQTFCSMTHKQSGGNGRVYLYLDGSQASGSGIYWGGYQDQQDYISTVGTYVYTTVDTNAHQFETYIYSSDGSNFYYAHQYSSVSLIATEIQG